MIKTEADDLVLLHNNAICEQSNPQLEIFNGLNYIHFETAVGKIVDVCLPLWENQANTSHAQ